MATDIKAVRLTATGTAFDRPIRVKGISGVASGAALITIRDGGASGETVAVFDAATGNFSPEIPAEGIRCRTDCHVTVTNITGITLLGG